MKNTAIILLASLILSSCERPGDDSPGSITTYNSLPDQAKICVFGDSGKNNSDQHLVGEAMSREGCNHMRHTGDIIYDYGLASAEDKQFLTKFYNPYRKLIEDQNLNFHMSLGNHDYILNPAAWVKLAQKHSFLKFPSFYYAEIFGDICFNILDTNANFDKQKTWIDGTLKDAFKDCKFIISQAHHPYFSSGSHGDAKNEVKELYESHINGWADLSLSGHDHLQTDEGELEGTRFLVTGSAATTREFIRTPHVWGSKKLGYLVLTINRSEDETDSIKYEFKTVNADATTQTEHEGLIVK